MYMCTKLDLPWWGYSKSGYCIATTRSHPTWMAASDSTPFIGGSYTSHLCSCFRL